MFYGDAEFLNRISDSFGLGPNEISFFSGTIGIFSMPRRIEAGTLLVSQPMLRRRPSGKDRPSRVLTLSRARSQPQFDLFDPVLFP